MEIGKPGKPSISMGHLYHGELLNYQRVNAISGRGEFSWLGLSILTWVSLKIMKDFSKTESGTVLVINPLGSRPLGDFHGPGPSFVPAAPRIPTS